MGRKFIFTASLNEALYDYEFFLEKDYPNKEVLKLIGNRYQLNHFQRTLLYRGIFKKEVCKKREHKQVSTFTSSCLYIDGNNVLSVIINYFLGIPLFIAQDHFLRDTGNRSTSANKQIIKQATYYVMNYLAYQNLDGIYMYFDKIHPNNTMLSNYVAQERLSSLKQVSHIKQADKRLIQKKGGNIATADSDIIDHTQSPVFDLAKAVLYTYFAPDFSNLSGGSYGKNPK